MTAEGNGYSTIIVILIVIVTVSLSSISLSTSLYCCYNQSYHYRYISSLLTLSLLSLISSKVLLHFFQYDHHWNHHKGTIIISSIVIAILLKLKSTAGIRTPAHSTEQFPALSYWMSFFPLNLSFFFSLDIMTIITILISMAIITEINTKEQLW